jgi:hypothetical protein
MSEQQSSAVSEQPVEYRWRNPGSTDWIHQKEKPTGFNYCRKDAEVQALYARPVGTEPQTASVNEARDRIIGLIADLQGEHEVMCGRPIDPTAWKIEVPVSDLQALVGAHSQAESDGEGK